MIVFLSSDRRIEGRHPPLDFRTPENLFLFFFCFGILVLFFYFSLWRVKWSLLNIACKDSPRTRSVREGPSCRLFRFPSVLTQSGDFYWSLSHLPGPFCFPFIVLVFSNPFLSPFAEFSGKIFLPTRVSLLVNDSFLVLALECNLSFAATMGSTWPPSRVDPSSEKSRVSSLPPPFLHGASCRKTPLVQNIPKTLTFRALVLGFPPPPLFILPPFIAE